MDHSREFELAHPPPGDCQVLFSKVLIDLLLCDQWDMWQQLKREGSYLWRIIPVGLHAGGAWVVGSFR